MKHEVIVYRSPIEAWYWDNPEYIVYLVVTDRVGIIGICLLIGWLVSQWNNRNRH